MTAAMPGHDRSTSVQIGRFRCTMMCDSKLGYPVDYMVSGPDQEQWLGLLGTELGSTVTFPTYCLMIESDEGRVLVDGGDGIRDDRPVDQNGHLLDRLTEQNLQPVDIDTVIISHVHTDHTAGLLKVEGASLTPVFTNARHVMSEAEAVAVLDRPLDPDTAPELADYLNTCRADVAAIDDHAAIDRIGPNGVVETGIRLVDLPGHSPGHAGVLVEDAGQALLFMADAFHFTFEFAHLHLTSGMDPDPRRVTSSKHEAIRLALELDAIVSATHFAEPFGRLARSRDSIVFHPIEL